MRRELCLKEEVLKNTKNDLKLKEKEISKLKKQRKEDSKKQLSLLKDVEANKQVVLELEEAEKRRLELEEQLAADRATIDLLREDFQKKELRVSSEPERQMSLGKRILSYYETEKKLTPEQEEVVDSPMSSSPYLIRGVAGSGKSVVLTKHVVNRVLDAYQKYEGGLKLENPLKIGVVCFNRSLAPYLRETIVNSLESWCGKDQSPEEVAAQYVECQSMNSFLYGLSRKGYCKYKRIDRFGGIDYVHYTKEFKSLKNNDPQKYDEMLFDTVYVDESQDLSPEGFQVLMEMLRPGKNDEKNLIIFYDDAQNLYGRKRPIWKDLGIKVDVGRRSKFLSACHRNTKETMDFAFNMLMGTCSVKGAKTVNMASFADVSNLKKRGLVSLEDDLYRVHFSSRSGEPVEVRGFRDRRDEKRWVYSQVKELIKNEKVLPDDILVLFPCKKMYDDLDGAFQKLPIINGVIHPHGKDKDSFPFMSDYLTISTIHSAKGLGAPIVFLIGVDHCQNDERGRAAFYVGATRAKLKLFVTGVVGSRSVIEESIAVKKALDLGQ
ncbi:MAG: 3'-5' exonuclease [Synergistota bacterium]|nr:3'-5' exonuclease [Synergistota bacterium]